MTKIDLFTEKRLIRFVMAFRQKSGQLPTLADLAEAGFDKDFVKQAERLGIIEKFYLNLTTGQTVKGFKVHESRLKKPRL